MDREKKINKGITLIALVVTIVILLILAGVTIGILMGRNGILKQAEIAKIEHNRSQIREYLDLKLVEEKMDHYRHTEKVIIEATRENVDNHQNDLKQFGKTIEIQEVIEEEEKVYFYVIVDQDVYEVSLKGTKLIGEKSEEEIELQKGDIEFTYSPSEWTNTNVKIGITVNKSIENYDLQYKTKESEWQPYTEEIEVGKNQTIYARLAGVLGQTTVATGTVANIDKLAPNVFTPTATSTTNSIIITANATDAERTSDNGSSGISGYRFSKDNGTSWSADQTSGSYTFTGLTQTTNYTILVEAKDKAGNVRQASIHKTTETVPGIQTGDITFNYLPATATNGNVVVGIAGNTTGYMVQYKTEKTGQSGEVSTWTNYGGTFTLTRNQSIYARVVDNTGQSASTYATGTVANIDKLAPNVFTPTATSTTNSITVTANATDAERTSDNGSSGIAGYRFSQDNGSTWTAYQTSGSYTFTGLTQTTSYTILVEAKDKAGNVRRASVSKGTGTVPANISIGYSTTNWTNGNVVVTATANISGYTLQYKNGSTWSNYTTGITLTSNGSVYFRLWDGYNAGATATGTVANIDKTIPTIGNVTGSNTTANVGTITVTNVADTGGSGLSGYYVSTSSTTPTATSVTWTTLSGSSFTRNVPANGTYYVWVKDKAGNVSAVKSCTISGIVPIVSIGEYKNLTVLIGNTGTPNLTYTGSPKTKVFSSSNTAVASVNASTGVVTGIKAGTATITVIMTNYTSNSDIPATVSKSCTVTVQNGVAAIGGKHYPTIQGAVTEASTSTITMLANRTESVTIPAGKNITLALNGKTIVGTITNNAVLAVYGGTINGNTGSAIINNGTLTVSGSTNIASSATAATTIANYGTATLAGGSITSTNYWCVGTGTASTIRTILSGANLTSSGSGCVWAYGITTISAGTFTGNGNHRTVNINAGGTLTVTGGTLISNGNKQVVGLAAGSVANISGGTLSSRTYGVIALYGATATITGSAKIQRLNAIENQSAVALNSASDILYVKGGTITTSGANTSVVPNGININQAGKVYMNGGTISSTTANCVNMDAGYFEMTGGTLTTSSNSHTALVVNAGTVMLKKGTLKNTGGFRAIVNAGTTTVQGSTNAEVLIQSNSTTKGSATVKNTGTFKFLVGTIKNTAGGYAIYNDGGKWTKGGSVSGLTAY